MQRPPKGLTPSGLRLLEAVLALADEGGPITTRRINLKLGWRGFTWTSYILPTLKAHGLVDFEMRRGRIRSGTIRPTVRFILASELEREAHHEV